MKAKENSFTTELFLKDQVLVADAADDKKRLDHFLKERLEEFSRSQIQKWIKGGHVLCDGDKVESSFKLRAGQRVAYHVPEEEIDVVPENIVLDILYEDDSILVINKSAGVVTHPAKGHLKGTVLNAVAYHLGRKELPFPESKEIQKYDSKRNDRSGNFRPGIVHRLDRDTSGVLVIAKTTPVLENLSRQFRERNIGKIYRAIVCGRVQEKKGEIVGAIGKEYRSSKMAVTTTGRFSETHFKVLKIFQRHGCSPVTSQGDGASSFKTRSPTLGHSYIEIVPKTGRTHQIRVHLSAIGYPILGDGMYGGETGFGCRQMLHAYKITLCHPKTKKEVTFTAPLPEDFLEMLKKLGAK